MKKLQEAREGIGREKPAREGQCNSSWVSAREGRPRRNSAQLQYQMADVSQNATDHAGFEPMVEEAERNLGALLKEGTAAGRYPSYDDLEYAEVKGLDLYMPDNFLEVPGKKEESEKQYHKSNFE